MGVSLNDLDAQLSRLADSSSDSECSSVSLENTSSKKRALTSKQKSILSKKRRLGQSTLCFRFVTGECTFSDCIFRHVRKFTPADQAEFLRELKLRPFDRKLSEFARALNIPLCKEFTKQGACRHRTCQFWHLEDERIAKWAGFEFFCQLCFRGFTSQTQLEEHKLGKLHTSRI
jgi:hypothetical protein